MHPSTRKQGFAVATCMLNSALLICMALPGSARSQAVEAADGPGSFIQVGGTVSGYHLPYGQHQLGGATVFLDANLYRRTGVEVEVRSLRINQDEGVHDRTYLAGPRYSILAGSVRPYAKLLVGRGQFWYPFNYATGSYFVVAPGMGVDWHLRRSRLMIRLIDFEYQVWPGFSFGPLKPYGISSGFAFRIF